METHELLFAIALILVSARVFAEFAQRIGVPVIIGELLAGIVIGPSLLGLVEPNDVIRLLAEIGIIMLLFQVGIESNIEKLIKAGPRAFVLASAGFAFPFALGFLACKYIFDLPLIVCLFVGGTLTATSIGVTVRILAELGRHNSTEGQIVLGAAVIDDVLGVLLLAVLYEFASSGTITVYHAGEVAVYVTLFFVAAPILAKLVSLLLLRYHLLADLPGVIPVTFVAIILLAAAAAHSVGAPELLGGFAAGIALSRRFFLPFGASLRHDPVFTERVVNEMRPVVHLFTPIFFVMVGLSLDLSAIDWTSTFIWLFSITLTVFAIMGKLAGGWMLPVPLHFRTVIGMAMVPRGEVGLIFAELGRVSGIFSNEVYAGMVIVIAYTTLLAPFWIKMYYKHYGHMLEQQEHLLFKKV